MKFGLKAERWMVELLKRNGHQVIPATRVEDKAFHVDFWILWNRCWIAIQFSVDKDAILTWKGRDALRHGIVPIWIDGQELEIAYSNGNGIGLVKEFWTRIEKLLIAYPTVKRFLEPRWNSYSIINK